MYENLYSYDEKINGKSVLILFKPNFREEITLLGADSEVLSDGDIRLNGELVLNDTRSKFPKVYVSEDAQWVLEKEGNYAYHIFVTERTDIIDTPLGEEWNREFNRLLKKCKKAYYQEKKEEIRLYFYDFSNDKLSLCHFDCYYTTYSSNSNYKYNLERFYPTYCAIDKRYPKPEKDCFILGRIRKTIGLKNSKLLDFIEPVYNIKLDFEKQEKSDFEEYEEQKRDLTDILFKLLRLCVQKEYDQNTEYMRIKTYIQRKHTEQVDIMSEFKKEIWNSFQKGNVRELRQLYDVVNEPQDVTNVEFELRLEKEIYCTPDESRMVYFANGENGFVTAQWISKNIDKCTDANVTYLQLRNRYNFY